MALLEPVRGSGLWWIVNSAEFAIVMIGAATILGVQYFRRRTSVSRILTGSVVALSVMMWFMPWNTAFAVQKSLSSATESSRAVAFNFEPAAGRFQEQAGAFTSNDSRRGDGSIPIYLPISVVGLPPDSAIQTDHSEVRLIANSWSERIVPERWNARREGSGSPKQTVYPPIGIPAAVYNRIKDDTVRLEFDYSLTLVQVTSSGFLSAIGGNQQVPGVGSCRTDINSADTAIEFSCVVAGKVPTCVHFFLEHVATGARNPDQFTCGSYFPFILDPMAPDALLRAGAYLPYQDPTGLTRYPVNGSKLRESRVAIQIYSARDHFTRKLVIPEVRLREWGAEFPNK
jgi:hypothetical protein